MTIGIAVSGPAAGLAAFRALRAVEAVGRGAIGGFVSFVAIDSRGKLVVAEVQSRGGAALFGGSEPPPRIASAALAALMSSGPDRPEPLIQFTPADPAAGLVTGHRLPNMPGKDGTPPNRIALARLAAGSSPAEAVSAALAPDPEADAGLIAMDLAGRIAIGNSPAVSRRDDLGEALAEDVVTGMRVGVLHNSIFPHHPLAELAVSVALDTAAPLDRADHDAGLLDVPLRLGKGRGLILDNNGRAREITVTESRWLDAAWEGSALRRGDPVYVQARLIGRITREVYCVAADGRIARGRGGDCAGWQLTDEAPFEIAPR